MHLSYARGARDVPLLDETIGANLRRTVERFPDREALVVAPPGLPRDLRRAVARGRPGGARADRPRRAGGRPRRHLGAEPVRVGRRPVRHRARRRDPRHDQPGLQGGRAAARARRTPGVSLLVLARGFRGHGLRRAARRGARGLPGAARDDRARGRLGRLPGRRRRGRRTPSSPRARRRCAPTTRSTSSTRRARPARPRARRSRTATSSTTRTSSARTLGYSERDRVCVPVPFYHCFGMVLGNLACVDARRLHRRAGRVVRAARRARDGRGRALHVALRRADDVHRRARPSRASTRSTSSSLRTGIMGGAPCPVEVMKQVPLAHAHERGRDRLRHDRDLAAVDADGAGRPARRSASATVGRVHPHVEIKVVDPETGETVPRGVAGRAVHARLQRDARLLGRPGRRRARAIDADGWMHTGDLAVMDDDGYVQHRRPHQGHDHPRRREHLPARDRGVPARAARASPTPTSSACPSERYGEEVMAWVQAARRRAADRRRTSSPPAAAGSPPSRSPRHWRIVDDFPMTVTGKIQKFRLRELAAASMNCVVCRSATDGVAAVHPECVGRGCSARPAGRRGAARGGHDAGRDRVGGSTGRAQHLVDLRRPTPSSAPYSSCRRHHLYVGVCGVPAGESSHSS